MSAKAPLGGLRILLVEDEGFVAMMAEDALEKAGAQVVVAMRLGPGLMALGKHDFDAAVLDINLHGEKSFPIARELSERDIPFIFASGYGEAGLDEMFVGIRMVNKPYTERELVEAVTQILA